MGLAHPTTFIRWTAIFFQISDVYMEFFPPRQVTVGDPNDPANKMGALVSKEHMAKVTGYVQLAREQGCSVLCGQGVEELTLPERNRNGYFVRPTVITDVSDQSPLMQEEVFGPVTCIVPFKTEEEVQRNNEYWGMKF